MNGTIVTIIVIVVVLLLILSVILSDNQVHKRPYVVRPNKLPPSPPDKSNEKVLTRTELDILKHHLNLQPEWFRYGNDVFRREDIIAITSTESKKAIICLRGLPDIPADIDFDKLIYALRLNAIDLQKLVERYSQLTLKPEVLSRWEKLKTERVNPSPTGEKSI